LLATLLTALAEPVPGQPVIARGNWTFDTTQLALQYNAVSTGTATHYGGSGAVCVARADGTATQNFYIFTPDQSKFERRTRIYQPFALNTQSVVQVPRYFQGLISFFGSNPDSYGMVSGAWEILDNFNNVVYSQGAFLNGWSDQAVNNANLGTVTLPAGNYTFRGTLVVLGYTAANGGGGTGSGVTIDFNTPTRGLATALGAWATGLGNSRAAIGAPAARTDFEVDGTGVDVGLIEVGRPYRNGTGSGDPGDWSGAHPSLAGRLYVMNASVARDTNFRNEHAQAVASIIASDDPDPANAGIAPGATITTAATATYPGTWSARFRAALDALLGQNIKVINMSMTSGDTDNSSDPADDWRFLNQRLNANPEVTFVKSAGNNGVGVTAPGAAHNAIVVGGLNRDFTQRAPYSSFGTTVAGLNPFKPDLVAPSEQINAAAAFGGGFTRAFTGEAFDTTLGPVTGEITGTSFAAPHVSGTVALLHHYYNTHAGTHDRDQRVIKAVLMNSADRSVLTANGNFWSQDTVGSATPADPLVVRRSLDWELGAGMVDAHAALRQYEPDEVRFADNNTAQNFTIDVRGKNIWWDHETVQPLSAALGPGTVDYLLGGIGGPFSATLVWNMQEHPIVPELLHVPELELRLYQEGDTLNNRLGFDEADVLIARTFGRFYPDDPQNVGLFDFTLPAPTIGGTWNPNAGSYYLSVMNFELEWGATQFGLAVWIIPEPGAAVLLSIGLALLFGLGQRWSRQPDAEPRTPGSC